MFLKLLGRIQRCFTQNSGFILLFFVFNYFTMAWSLTHQHQFTLLLESAAMLFLETMIFAAVFFLCKSIIAIVIGSITT